MAEICLCRKRKEKSLILGGAVVQAFAQFLTGAEERHALFAHGY
jgi:hypothetical protein